jgi:hypothetical protein
VAFRAVEIDVNSDSRNATEGAAYRKTSAPSQDVYGVLMHPTGVSARN